MTQTETVRGGRLYPEADALLLLMRKAGPGYLLPVEEFRAMAASSTVYAFPESGIKEVVELSIPGPGGDIALKIFVPEAEGPVPVLLYYHGGGWVLGNDTGHANLGATYAARFQYLVIMVDYRLAPEHAFPAAVDDSYAALVWAAANAGTYGGDGSKLATIGESAGANLSGGMALMTKEKGGPSISATVMACPVISTAMDTASYDEFADDPFCGREEMVWFFDQYTPSKEARLNPYVSLDKASGHSGLPPTMILTGECDVLRDEGEAYAETLKKAGVKVTAVRCDRQFHNSMLFNNLFADKGIVTSTYDKIGAFLAAAFDGTAE